ncbi:endoplasmic reticulum vesicle transporter [Nitzschia inconspicua]|uniref:Endoplasmic reticulum vesicle transporter n=1 Tax=Nitzschia inconspicua TaxID=303405 RepID=A0A9K3PEU7_9STRA|nr:endoplasmic reticulum vesicle transporter [Nitzschia inconspicua]
MSSYGNPRSSSRPWQAHVDMYRKLPVDLMEGSRRGSMLSYLSLMLMVVLLFWETRAFFQTTLVTDLALDISDDPKIRLNFNITMTDLRCDWAVIDVVSVLGTDQNVTAHVTKWNVDATGIRKGYRGRNRNQKDIVLFDEAVTESIEDLHANGEDAISLDETTLEIFKKEHDYVFVDFYASWCSHCKDLAPTWETLAEVMIDAGKSDNAQGTGKMHLEDYSEEDYRHAENVKMPVVIAKVDCVTQPKVCNLRENIRAYPTLRLFIDGKPWPGGSDYKGHRTVRDMVDWLAHMEEQHKSLLEQQGGEAEKARILHKAHEATRQRLGDDESEAVAWRTHQQNSMRRMYQEWKEAEHPGCQLSGHLLLDRAPGNFHILARSKHHDLAPHLTNVSHMVNSLSIGDPMAGMKVISGEAVVPDGVRDKISPMDGNVYTTMNLHESYHHYLKLITTKAPGLQVGRRDLKAYQIISSSQLAYYRNDMVPEAKFAYDLSPIRVSYRQFSRRWYDFCTSILALIGGMFTVVGLVESSIQATVSLSRRGGRSYRR